MTTKTDFKIEDLQLSPDMKNLPIIARYDEALKTLLNQVFAGQVILAPYERAFELYVGQQKDKIHFPFISLFPNQGYTQVNQNYAQEHIGHPMYRFAPVYDDDTLEKKGYTEHQQNFYQTLYYNIPYQIECWSTNRIEALQLVQELVFWLKAQSEVLVIYKDFKFHANLTVAPQIADNSAYTSYADLGNIYRFTINISIEAPVFRTENYLNITSSELELKLKED